MLYTSARVSYRSRSALVVDNLTSYSSSVSYCLPILVCATNLIQIDGCRHRRCSEIIGHWRIGQLPLLPIHRSVVFAGSLSGDSGGCLCGHKTGRSLAERHKLRAPKSWHSRFPKNLGTSSFCERIHVATQYGSIKVNEEVREAAS